LGFVGIFKRQSTSKCLLRKSRLEKIFFIIRS
jgi:hypothetical protein